MWHYQKGTAQYVVELWVSDLMRLGSNLGHDRLSL